MAFTFLVWTGICQVFVSLEVHTLEEKELST